MMLTKEQLQAADFRPFEIVDVPEWGGKVRVGAMTAKQRDDYEFTILCDKEASGTSRVNNIRAILLCRCLQNEDGSRMLTDADADWLGDKGVGAFERLVPVAQRVNAMTADDEAELLAKN